MSYLSAAGLDGSDFSQVIISLWFRVPQASIDAAYGAATGAGVLDGIIPLVVMGQKGSTTTYLLNPISVIAAISTNTGPVGGGGVDGPTLTFSDPAGPPSYNYTQTSTTIYIPANVISTTDSSKITVYSASAGDSTPTNPTCIGIDCNTAGQPVLYVNFETNKQGTSSNYLFALSGVTAGTSSGYDPTIAFYGQMGSIVQVDRYHPIAGFLYNISYENTVKSAAPPAAYINNGVVSSTPGHNDYADISNLALAGTAAITSDQIPVTADVWHHVLISLDLGPIATHGNTGPLEDATAPLSTWVDSAAQLFIALDDVNYTGHDLSANVVSDDGNDVINDDALTLAGTPISTDTIGPWGTGDPIGGQPTYEVEGTIPFGANPTGLPATPEFVDNIYEVEMAEFQMFTGIFADTSDESIRRYFIDSQGKPVPASQKSSATKGSGSIEGLGLTPDILLHGSLNWAIGKNTGFLGMDYSQTPPQIIDAGQFAPTAIIAPWKPDPSLYGPQKPA